MPQADSILFALNRDSIDSRLNSDSTCLEVETWRWYADSHNNYQEVISMSSYPSGEYMVQIAVDKNVYGEKVIKR